MRAVQLREFEDALEEELPAEAAAVPSMMSTDERRFLYGYTRKHYRGEGRIFDGGAFLGASTLCFGTGVRDNAAAERIRGRWAAPIVTFEQALVRKNLQRTLTKHGIELQDGESFKHVLRANITPVLDLVRLRIGDILKERWGEDPIEMLYLDVLKSRPIMDYVCGMTFPRLKAGAIVLHQDYFFDGLPYLKIKQEYLSDYFTYVGEISSMAVFKLAAPVPADLLATDVARDLELATRVRLLDAARDRTLDPDRRFLVELSKVHVIAAAGRRDEAEALWHSLGEAFPEQRASSTRRMRKAFDKIAMSLQAER